MNGTVTASRRESWPVGLAAVLATAAMLFTAFTASVLVRRTAPDWTRISMPPPLWASTAILLTSSVVLEGARRKRPGALPVTFLLAGTFLSTQIMAWRSLADSGVFLAGSPHASFLYVLTAVHGLHLLGGIGALIYATVRVSALPACIVYWHFVGALWIWILLLLWVI